MDPVLELCRQILNQPRKGPLRIEIHRSHEPADGSDAEPASPTARLHTEGAPRPQENEVSGSAYWRGAVENVMGIDLTPPKLGEVPRLAEQLGLEVDRLEKDVAVLTEKLAPALLPSLLENNSVNVASDEGVPGTQLGRKLRESIANVARIRLQLQDLASRTGL